MPRVLHAIRTVDARQTGGAEELLLLLSPALRERGRFEPAIMLLRKPDPAADPAKDFGNRARSLGLDVLPLQQMKMRPAWLRALPRRMGISIIHIHGQRANYFVWLMRRLFPRAWGRLPLVATVHGWVQDNFVRKVVTRLEFMTLRDCDHVITVSEQQRRTLLSKGFKPHRVSVVRPGIPYLASGQRHLATGEERAAARAHWDLPEDAYVITAVGRLSTEKRFDLYLEMCAALTQRLPEARFLLVGGGKQEANLRALASNLGLDDRLTFTGLTREMESIYAATDLLALTSDTEGTPHVLLEAMGSGIPVVSTSVGGVPEFITHEEHGLLVPPGDRDALVKAVMRLHDDKTLAARLIAGGSAVAAEFTVDRMAEGVEKVYAKVLGSTGET
ncbi:MAG TPA: glycosyltransferase family 4 protein [Chloroflexia bacterium]|nr:glycosyltransferase family 4 protein [Chloroflexia bacterium]